jgi:hypothetical protein
MPMHPGANRQGMPPQRPTEEPPVFDAVQSRERQYRQHGQVVDGKRDGYRVGPRSDMAPERDYVSGQGI